MFTMCSPNKKQEQVIVKEQITLSPQETQNDDSDSIIFAQILNKINQGGFKYYKLRNIDKETAKCDELNEIIQHNIKYIQRVFFDEDSVVKPLFCFEQVVFNNSDSAKLFAEQTYKYKVHPTNYLPPDKERIETTENWRSRVYLREKSVYVLNSWEADKNEYNKLLIYCDSITWDKLYK